MRPFIDVLPLAQRKNGAGISVDGVTLLELMKLGHSPLYVTALRAIEGRARAYKECLKGHFLNSNIYYAVKANFSYPVLKAVLSQDCGADIVSFGEWKAARKAGFGANKICYAGVGKRPDEWKAAIRDGLGVLNVEHIQELDEVLEFLYEVPSQTSLALRLNPCVESKTHSHLKTGALDSKFGVIFPHVVEWINKLSNKSHKYDLTKFLKPLSGIHVHIGSQIENPEIISQVVEKVLQCAQLFVENGIHINHLDFGGGLHVAFEGVPKDNSDIVRHIDFLSHSLKTQLQVFPKLKTLWGTNCENLLVSLEPGRSVVASSTVYLTRVLFEKDNGDGHRFCYVDAGMNDFPRPSLYGAKHQLIYANGTDFLTAEHAFKVVGPVCESGDVLASDVMLPKMKRGDWLMFFEAGAYCRSMASQYNLREIPMEVFIRSAKIEECISATEAFI